MLGPITGAFALTGSRSAALTDDVKAPSEIAAPAISADADFSIDMTRSPAPFFQHRRSPWRRARGCPFVAAVQNRNIKDRCATPSGGEGRVRTHPARFHYASAVPVVTNR